MVERGTSLLPSGIRAVEGDFGRGDCVEILAPGGEVVARGLAGYSADDLRRIAGRKSHEIQGELGYRYHDAALHRDDLVVLKEETR